jgi:hypothetical protein
MKTPLLFASLLSLVSCSSSTDGPSGASGGGAPSILEITMQPARVQVSAQPVQVNAQIKFTDPEGDIEAAAGEAVFASGDKVQIPRTVVTGSTQGRKDGILIFALALAVTHADTVSFTLWVIDKAGHESNRGKATLEIE